MRDEEMIVDGVERMSEKNVGEIVGGGSLRTD